MDNIWDSFFVKKSTKVGILSLVGGIGVLAGIMRVSQARDVSVRVDRWLTLQQLNGEVTYWKNSRSRPARSGDRLQAVGDGASTGRNSSASLQIDLGIGQVNLAEQTRVNMQELRSTPNGGKVTRLNVSRGRVQVRVRPFNNPDSQLEIDTPAGVAGVRGTQFGVNVQQSGRMSIATNQGSVASSAQGKSVLVNSGFQNFTIPGEPPSDPVPLSNDTSLDYQFVKRLENRVRRLRLEGRVDPVNIVLVDEIEQNIDRNGRFNVELDANSFPQVRVTVLTPLGLRQDYALAFQ
ncbi:MAG: FecR family protein [Leptolyngbya sp. Prado105]|jgi:hypothetical protein|nr:FecR family protein [Leptolyngbya sp. Prado105]